MINTSKRLACPILLSAIVTLISSVGCEPVFIRNADGGTGAGGSGVGGSGAGGSGVGGSGVGGNTTLVDGGSGGVDPSCKDVKIRLGTTTDGLYTIQPAGTRPFQVWCHGMSTTMPAEFLTLPMVSSSGQKTANYSEYVFGPVHGGQQCPCNSTVTRYSRIRIDPATLRVTVGDATFAVVDLVDANATCFSTNASTCSVGAHAYAYAGSCVTVSFAGGHGSIDLTGTPFHVAPSAVFASTGYAPVGSATFETSRKTASLTGGGDCGDFAATPDLPLEQDP